jgi:phospholipid/cholesterol/gamma-HCH transport system substrate-binding protein
MIRKARNEVLVGAFISGGLLLLLLLLFLMGSLDTLFARTEIVEVDFADVQGLQAGDQVFVCGEKEGKVATIKLLPFEEGKPSVVRVGLRVSRPAREHIREDAVVRIDKELTGNLSVVVGNSSGKQLQAGGRLVGTRAADLTEVAQKFDRVLDEGGKMVQTIARVIKDIEAKGDVKAAISELAEIARRVKSDVLPIADRVKDTLELVQGVIEENRLDVRHTVANLKETTSAAKTLTESLRETPAKLEQGLAALEKAGSQVAGLLNDNRVNIDALLEDARQVAANTANLTAEIKRRPWRLLYKPSEDEMKAMELFDAAWAYNLGASELNRSLRSLAARIEKDPGGQASPGELQEARQQVAASLRRHREAEEKFWEKLQGSE